MVSLTQIRHKFPAVCGTIAFSFASLAFTASPSSIASAQDAATEVENEAETEVEQKVIREPIHRVPKIASNTGPAALNVAPKRANVAGNPLSKNINSITPAMLPSASKVVPANEPVSEPEAVESSAEPATEPGVDRASIPVLPVSSARVVAAPHPLDDALETARRGLENMRANVRDYSAIMVKRERVNGSLLKPEYMQVKVRSERVLETGQQVPFSIYMKFIKPRASAGREVIWVKGRNKNQICVHEGSGLVSLKRFQLDPDSWIAMKGQRYPIYEAGLENLIVKLIEKAERDRAAGHCEVVYRDGVKINGRECSVIEVTHPKCCAPYDFHIAKVYIDKELKMPIRYQALLWPEPGQTKPQLLEEYTYLNVKINQGFTDQDFNPDNPAYSYPNR
ncbi:DUF1571 domain-containing protein [Mariniblastus fucicola]|uniref:DUF1571 domain-containing protein n=1 Tax=Mariniblastus fucicola TaxID=980251 RepID=A0A5B9PJA0_9BACT|nr:DUF1571 domain-containing protein [Mariniblastus fucicola]QEG22761.1 hypothetical protein MFFC18_26440 [Mariniblastus fucicola]